MTVPSDSLPKLVGWQHGTKYNKKWLSITGDSHFIFEVKMIDIDSILYIYAVKIC